MTNLAAMLQAINDRLTRVETRLVQLMLYEGMDPYAKLSDSRREDYQDREEYQERKGDL